MINTNNNTETAADSKCTEWSWRHIQRIKKKPKSFIIYTNNRVLLFLLYIFFSFYYRNTNIIYIHPTFILSKLRIANCLKSFKTNFIVSSPLHSTGANALVSGIRCQERAKYLVKLSFCFTVLHFLAYCFF